MFTVLTGDIVASSDLDAKALTQTLETIGDAAKSIAHWPNVTQIGFARRAGDAWQIAFDAPDYALRAALVVQANVRRLGKTRSTRIAIATGIGTMPAQDPNEAHGAAFTASGRLLDALPAPCHISDAAGGTRAAAAMLAGYIADGWTSAQAQAMALHLPPNAPARDATAKALGITRQAVNDALWSAGFTEIIAALKAVETPD